MADKVKYLVEKSNVLNTLQSTDMSLNELRFFCLYLSKINARNVDNRTVNIPIEEFEDLFGIKVNTTLFNRKIMDIASRVVKIKENGKIKILTLYSEFCWKENEPSVISITCNDKMLPYLFELKKNYTTYMIVNIAKLNSVQQIRLYEICKQYQNLGMIKIELKDLQEMMCCKVSNYPDFNQKTLKPAIKDINQYTDIQVSYEKVLSCRKVVALTFTIKSKNQVQIEIQEPVETVENTVESYRNISLEDLYYRCDKAYTVDELEMLIDYITNSGIKLNISVENYIYSVYMNIKIKGNKVNNLFRYTFSVIEKQVNEYIFAPNKQKEEKQEVQPQKKKKRETSYDLDDYKRFLDYNLGNIGNQD